MAATGGSNLDCGDFIGSWKQRPYARTDECAYRCGWWVGVDSRGSQLAQVISWRCWCDSDELIARTLSSKV